MKISERRSNTFQGSYYGYHDEMDWKETPLYLKLLFFLMVFIVLCGTVFSIYMAKQDNWEWMVKAILLTISLCFILVHIIGVLFDIAKYGKIRKQIKYIGSVFSAVGICILIGVLLAKVIPFWILLMTGLMLVFISIGAGLWIAGEKKLKRIKTVCTRPVMATCTGFETLNPHLPIYNEDNINPKDPQDIYSKDCSNAKYLVKIGKIWFIFSIFILAFILGIFYLIFASGVM